MLNQFILKWVGIVLIAAGVLWLVTIFVSFIGGATAQNDQGDCVGRAQATFNTHAVTKCLKPQ